MAEAALSISREDDGTVTYYFLEDLPRCISFSCGYVTNIWRSFEDRQVAFGPWSQSGGEGASFRKRISYGSVDLVAILAVIKLLLENAPDAKVQGRSGLPAAAPRGHLGVVKLLLNRREYRGRIF